MHGEEPEEGQGAIPEKGDNVSEVKVKVPNGMLKAVGDRYGDVYAFAFNRKVVTADLEAALRWLAENPIVPTHKQMRDWCDENKVRYHAPFFPYLFQAISDLQRRMFLAPEPEFIGNETVAQFCARFQTIGEAAIEAYRLGQKSPS